MQGSVVSAGDRVEVTDDDAVTLCCVCSDKHGRKLLLSSPRLLLYWPEILGDVARVLMVVVLCSNFDVLPESASVLPAHVPPPCDSSTIVYAHNVARVRRRRGRQSADVENKKADETSLR